MNKIVRGVISALLCLLLCAALAACSESDGKDGGDVALVPKDDFEPVTDNGIGSELYKRYEQYKENASLAFVSCDPASPDAFSYVSDNGEVRIEKYIGEDAIVVIPDEIDGVPVRSIGEGAFESTKLRALYIPDSVKAIAQGAIVGCDNLSTLRLPFIGDGADNAFLGYIFGASAFDENAVKIGVSLDMLILGEGVDSIEENALRGCKTLSALIFPDSLCKIGKLALYGCTDLVYVSFGDGVESVGEYSFAHCSSLYAIDFADAFVGDGALYSCTSINTVGYTPADGDFLGRIFGAESVEYNFDFVPASLRNVNISEGCKNIPNMTFASCKYVTKVTLPESLESIGVRAFYACRSLSEIKIGDGVKKIGDDAFFGCDALASVELGDSIESLGMQAFYGCKSLQSVTLPQSLKEIKSSTFYGCEALERISLGGVKTVGKDAFGGCGSLSPVSVGGVTVAEGNNALVGE